MRARHRAPVVGFPRHRDRPKQWVHLPWLMLGMLFVTAVLVAAPYADNTVPFGELPSPTGEVGP